MKEYGLEFHPNRTPPLYGVRTKVGTSWLGLYYHPAAANRWHRVQLRVTRAGRCYVEAYNSVEERSFAELKGHIDHVAWLLRTLRHAEDPRFADRAVNDSLCHRGWDVTN